MNWCFALINGKLAEIYFEPKKGDPKILGHAYVKKEQYQTKKEQEYISNDTEKFQFSYKNRIYRNMNSGKLPQQRSL